MYIDTFNLRRRLSTYYALDEVIIPILADEASIRMKPSTDEWPVALERLFLWE